LLFLHVNIIFILDGMKLTAKINFTIEKNFQLNLANIFTTLYKNVLILLKLRSPSQTYVMQFVQVHQGH
jgi:hypothetical protein